MVCTLKAKLATRLAVYCTQGRVMVDDFFIRPKTVTIHRNGADAPEELVTSWPGGGYTYEAQEVMRCLRTGEQESPLVPWADTLAVARTLARWQAAVDGSAGSAG